MKYIVDYMVVSESCSSDLARRVRSHTKDGWQPFGNMAFAYNQFGFTWAQAMVKYDGCVSTGPR
jgi:hypothetical protein